MTEHDMAELPPRPAGTSWTDEQWRAIVQSGRNVLVAAAAGSGKTAVLVERIIRKISADTDVDRLLVATFTNAAAAEMKERIRLALEQALERNPGSEHLRRQLALMGRASITTLHSFCLDVIRRHYPLIGLDPGFRIANETEAELLRAEVLNDLFEEKYADGGDDFLLLAETFGGDRSDEPLARLVLDLYQYALSHPWPEAWLRSSAAAFRIARPDELADSEWVRSLRDGTLLELEAASALLRQALDLAGMPMGPAAYAGTLAEDLAVVDRLRRIVADEPWPDWFPAFREAEFEPLKRQRGGDVDKELQERAKALRDKAKSIVAGLASELFNRTPEDYAAELNGIHPLMAALAELVIDFSRRFEAAKRARGLVDFGDLEHYCLRILRDPASTPERTMPSAAALEYQEQFDEILLDEYQDTNMVQEAIVDLIARPGAGNRFMVGDVKQSIYRFRLAEPGLFLEKYRRYAADGASAAEREAAPGLRIDLARNFRSRREVVDGVNDVFRVIMRERAAEMDYDERAELKFGAPYPDADPGLDGEDRFAVECVLLDRAGESDAAEEAAADGETPEEAAAREAAEEAAELETAQLEARWIAARIRAMIRGEDESGRPLRVYDPKRRVHRRASWRDFVILLRSPGASAQAMVDELAAAGIPAYAELKGGYFEQTEVETVLSLLRVIDNPYQDIPLAGTLRSPIGGLDAEELAAVRLAAGSGPYFDAVLHAADDPDVPLTLRRKLSAFLNRLERWRDEARQGSLTDLIRRIYGETGFYDLAGGLPGGAQRQANLRALLDRAKQYEETSFRGLYRFLRFIDRLREGGGDLGTARALGEQDDVVRIMSIHASKGLEFPVVFIAGLGRMFNQGDLNGPFLMHKQLGFGPKLLDTGLRVSYPSLPYLAIRRRLKMEMLAEEMRVLYVAMTRPKEKMILLGTAPDAEKALQRWRDAAGPDGAVPDHALVSARCYLDWLMPLVAAAFEPAQAETVEGAAAAFGWRPGIIPSTLLAAAAEAAAGTDAEAEAERQEWLSRLTALEPLPSAGAYADIVERRLGWRYPYAEASSIAAKTSVTEMKRMLAEAGRDEDAEQLVHIPSPSPGRGERGVFRLRRPRFLEERSLTPAERGSVMHLVMQHMPLTGPHGEDDVRAVVESMTARNLLTPAQAAAVDCAGIAAFFAGSLGRRLAGARWVKREVPFSRTVPAGRIRPDAAHAAAAADEPVLIQGVIDCLFEDEDGLVLIDYKTDRIFGGDAEAAAGRHRFQLELYAESIGSILGRKVDEAHLFFFDGARTVRVL